ncbi:MAG: cytochrome c oxidase subunit II [Acidobacteria bacterium]|nr:cytochrome c oxidase subunit II [Acidobacteriota bacterium]
MWSGFPLRPEQASTIAQGIDQLYFFLTAITLFFTFVIFTAIFYFAIRYRRKAKGEIPGQIEGSLPLEIFWSAVPLVLVVVIFVWSSSLFISNSRPPEAATEIFVIGKQWMWQLQHPDGAREINELHVPVGKPIKLTMTSEDVIHDFFIPAFRVKKDVVPGRYTSLWFEATKTGRFHLFCGQYCGVNHALMIGSVVVMEPEEYERWLSGSRKAETMAASGAQLYERFACITCHGAGKAPPFNDFYMSQVKLSDGSTVVANEEYIRESILYPSAKIHAGYDPIMPTFKGQISEEQLLQLIAFIKSLGPQERKSE